MRILCIIDSLGSGGAQRQMVGLAIGFKERGHDVEVLIYHPIYFFRKALDEKGILIHVLSESNFLLRVVKMRKFIRDFKPNSVLSFLQGANLIAELAGFPIKKWNLIVGERSANPEIAKNPVLIALRLMHIFADGVVSNSNKNIHIVKKANPFLSKKRLHVVYNTIDLDEWKSEAVTERKKNNRFVIAVAASVVENKNPYGVVKALNYLTKESRGKVQVQWFGKILDKEYYNKVLKFISENELEDCFVFKGESDKIKMEYEKADAVGLFSYKEGLPNAVCEGMAMSKVVISSNISDVPILLGMNNPELLFDPGNSKDISNSIKWLLNLKRADLEKMGKRNRRESKQLFNRDLIIEKYLKILKGKSE